MGSPPTPLLLHEHEDHSYDMVYMDPYLGAQIEVLDDSALPVDFAMVSDNLELSSSFIDVQFERNVHYFGLDNEVPSISKMEMEQVKDCFMGTEEETGSWQITPTASVDPTFRDIVNSGDFDCQMIPLEAAEEFNSSKQLLRKNEKVYRQRRFKKGWEEMKNKVVAMNNRIGTKTSIHAVFENVIYFMDINKGMHQTGNSSKVDFVLPEDNDSDSENSRAPSESSVVEGDHRYAAVILTQKESSSSIRDHQYNQESFSTSGFESSGSGNTHASTSMYMKGRYKRERQLVRYINTLFMKKQTLEGTTGAKIYLEISYEHYIFNSSNYKSAEETLSDNRKKIFRVPVISTVDLSNSSSSPTDIFANFNPNNPQIFMRVERVPSVGDIAPGIHVKYIKRKNKDSDYAISAPPPTTFDMPLTVAITNSDVINQEFTPALTRFNLTTSSSSLLSPEYLNLDHPYGLSPIMQFHQNDDGESSPQLVYNPPVQEETIEHDSDFDSMLLMHDLNRSSPKNAATITEPVCGLCGLIGVEDCSKEMWLRCFNSLCHYMAHPKCVGFRVSATQLAMLPPYLCPTHR